MKSKDWSSRVINHLFMGGVCAAMLLASNAFGQNPNATKQVWFLQPKAADQAMPGGKDAGGGKKQPEKIGQPGKVIPPFDPIADRLPTPLLEPGEEGLVINLPTALRLANAEAWDIIIATQQMQIAAAQLEGANVLWLPTLIAGADYNYHSGPIQDVNGSVINTSRSGLYAGGAPWPSSR